MRFVKTVLAVLALAVLAGCASGPRYNEMMTAIPSLSPNKGRIYFFRTDGFGGADVYLNGKVVGKSERGSFFFVDEYPGRCTVATSPDAEKPLAFVLGGSDTKYVKISGKQAVLVGSDIAGAEIASLHYTGAPLPKK